MKLQPIHLYLLNTALLIGHQVDSAVQHEWQLFGLLGGEQGFILSNLVLFAIVLFGLWKTFGKSGSAPAFSLTLAATGIATFGVHHYQVWRGSPEYSAPVSRLLLWLLLLVSLLQAWITLRRSQTEVRAKGAGA
jgi:hypothetical protein